MSSEGRWEGTLEEAEKVFYVLQAGGWIPHIVKNKQGDKYHVFRHINCDWCEYCDMSSPAQEVDNPMRDEP
jgi:hypothetical protein